VIVERADDRDTIDRFGVDRQLRERERQRHRLACVWKHKHALAVAAGWAIEFEPVAPRHIRGDADNRVVADGQTAPGRLLTTPPDVVGCGVGIPGGQLGSLADSDKPRWPDIVHMTPQGAESS
jgi:hypothetical protein